MKHASRVFLGVAVALTSGASLYLLGAGDASGTLVGASAAERAFARRTSSSLVDARGFAIVLPLALPVVIALLAWSRRHALARQRSTRLAALGMSAFVVAGSMSIGLYFMPSALALWISFGIDRWTRE